MMNHDSGTYQEIDGRPAVRFIRTYPHPVDRVWAAVTTPDELRRWFPSEVEIDLRAGGMVSFTGDPHAEDRKGAVLACDPPRRLAFTWGGNELRFELEPAGPDAGHCRFTLIDVLDERDAAARQAAGWHVCLAELDKLMTGQLPDGPHSATAEPWRPRYDAYVAAGLPSGADIPG